MFPLMNCGVPTLHLNGDGLYSTHAHKISFLPIQHASYCRARQSDRCSCGLKQFSPPSKILVRTEFEVTPRGTFPVLDTHWHLRPFNVMVPVHNSAPQKQVKMKEKKFEEINPTIVQPGLDQDALKLKHDDTNQDTPVETKSSKKGRPIFASQNWRRHLPKTREPRRWALDTPESPHTNFKMPLDPLFPGTKLQEEIQETVIPTDVIISETTKDQQ